VGAQSIAPAQSIGHGQMATVSVKKTKVLKNFFCRNFTCVFFRRPRIFVDFKTEF
jgi:hypothetical protein